MEKVPDGLRRPAYSAHLEPFSNIVRHANATTVDIKLRVSENVLMLEISDDGRGFSDPTTSQGHGLANMRRRASAMAGDIAIASEPGNGTSVTLRVKMTRTRGGQG